MLGLLWLSIGIALVPLLSVFGYVVSKGYSALNFEFFTSLPTPVGTPGGGVANSLLGSGTIVGIAGLIGIPWGIAVGVYLSEYGVGKVAAFMRFTTDLMTSIPSIVIGIFVYSVLVKPWLGFSAYAGGAALAIIIIPIVARTTEEVLRLVSASVREAALALGIPRWKVILRVVVRGSLPGILTGVMLAIARVAGETSPLLMTAFNNRFWSHGLGEPTATLPVQIYTYAISPFEDWHRQAWAGALVLTFFVLVLSLLARAILSRNKVRHD